MIKRVTARKMTARKIAAGKIAERKGASLIMALLYFLACAMIGTVILSAARVNLSRIRREKLREQNDLAVISAMELLERQLDGEDGSAISLAIEKESRKAVSSGNTRKCSFTFVLPETEEYSMPAVEAHMTIVPEEDGEVRIRIEWSSGENSSKVSTELVRYVADEREEDEAVVDEVKADEIEGYGADEAGFEEPELEER